MSTLAELVHGPDRVFPTHPRVERYFPATATEDARCRLTRCLQRGEGPALLIGAPGTGKTMLLQVLAEELGQQHAVVRLSGAQICTRRALLQSILFELQQPYQQRDEGELRLSLLHHISQRNHQEGGVIVLVDEAQSLGPRLLEELRALSNLSYHGEPQVRLLLAGSQALDENFATPEVEAFNQRIVVRCYLAPFDRSNTAQYIRGHLAIAGGNPNTLFTDDALAAVSDATGGIARLINQLGDRALLLADHQGLKQVTKQTIQAAWSDLQQLPTPWNLPTQTPAVEASSEAHGVIEFGPLADDPSAGEPLTAQPLPHQPFTALGANWDRSAEEDFPTEVPPVAESPTVKSAGSEPVVKTPKTLPAASQVPVAPSVTEAPQADPFEECFDEEEVIIDQFASFSVTLPSRHLTVINQRDSELSRLLADIRQYDEQAGQTSREEGPQVEAMVARTSEDDLVTAHTVDHDSASDDLSPLGQPELGQSALEPSALEPSALEPSALEPSDTGKVGSPVIWVSPQDAEDQDAEDDDAEDINATETLAPWQDWAPWQDQEEVEPLLSSPTSCSRAPEVLLVEDQEEEEEPKVRAIAVPVADYRQLFATLRAQ